MRSVRVRFSFEIAKALVPSVWIPFKSSHVWIEFKYERLPGFFYYCGRITHNSL